MLLMLLLTVQELPAQTILIKNVNIVDTENGKLISSRHVLIRDGIISQVTKGEVILTIKPDTVVDGTGRYLMPGLWDMHTHIWNEATTFPLLIANGITGVRGMFEMMNNVNRWREDISKGKIAGPQLMVAGPIVDGPKPVWPGSVAVKDEADGKRAVDSLKNKLKVDFIKVYSLLSRQNYLAIAAESRRQNIPFAGHVPNEITVVEAAEAGQKSQEHLYGMIESASDSADHWFAYLQGTVKDSTMKKRSLRKEFLFRTYNENKLKRLLQQIKKTDTWICPTLTVNRGIATVDDTTLLNDPRIAYMGKFIKGMWDFRTDFRFKSWTPLDFEQSKKEFELKLSITKLVYDAGIPILAGTDFPNPHCYAGFGIHDELELLVKAGLSAAAALQTATINPAKYFNLAATEGSVALNKNANLVLLTKNPLQNISNTKTIEMVFVKGKLFTTAQLEEMKEGVKKMLGGVVQQTFNTGMYADHDD